MKYFYALALLSFALFFSQLHCMAQSSPVYYISNYLRVVQPEFDDSSDLADKHPDLVTYHNAKVKYDTLLNPFTGGLNNPMFFNIDFNGDGISDLYVFDRELNENQFFLFEGLSNHSNLYRYAPSYHFGFPKNVVNWVEMADYNKDGLPDIFTGSNKCNTCVKAYKNTSYIDPVSKKFIPGFTKTADTLYYNIAGGQKSQVNFSPIGNPQFVDVDKDGYLDILGYGVDGFQYFRNTGKGADSLGFEFVSGCWGKFAQVQPHYYIPFSCGNGNGGGGPYYFSSVCAFDADGDGDIDLLLGNGRADSIVLLENGNINNNGKSYHKDTMINLLPFNNNNFPAEYPAKIATMPMPSLADVDHDSLSDMIISAGEPISVLTDTFHITDKIHNIWYYQNAGTKSTQALPGSNIFQLSTKDFLRNTMVDWGINSAPCFIDVDKDGRKDLIMAVWDASAPNSNSHLILYLNKLNKTTGAKPYLLYQTDDYLRFSLLHKNIGNPVPAAYLNTEDSVTDLIIGNDSGQIMYFKDRSTGKNPADFHLATSSLKWLSQGKMIPISVNTNSAPTAADINGDGKTDLLIGSNSGAISYYRCIGYDASADNIPYFELVTKTFGGLYANPGQNYQTAPCVADMDKDGKADLLIGDINGHLWYYHDFDTAHPLVPAYQVQVHDLGTGKDSAKQFSTYLIPAVANLDQDSFPDIMLGCRRGGLIFLGSANNGFENMHISGIESGNEINLVQASLYPNPAGNNFHIRYQNPMVKQSCRVTVTDMLGRQVLTQSFEPESGRGDEEISCSGFINGIYIVAIFSGNQLLYTGKLLINK